MFFKKKKITPKEFSQKFSKTLKSKVDRLEIIAIKDWEITTKCGEREHTHFMNNAYSEYQREPKELKDILNRYVSATASLYEEEKAITLENIIPIVKDIRYIAELERLNSDYKSKHVFEEYNENLYIFYAEDNELNIKYLTQEAFNNLEIQFDKLKELAIENLKRMVTIERHGENGYFMLTAGGNYESSLILLDIWTEENFDVIGNITIGIPSRDLLLITGNDDIENLKKIIETVAEINAEGDHLVSEKIFEYIDGRFEVSDLDR
jgi:uncharacterized protein YtpQ (UPF0354 family)